ncbi:hypothetical protein EV363DRAFT_1260537 [Boletus edulis]|nr:hypothetical protein EV363DRAFT_1260537 [Boletus edulis]
MKLHEAAPHEVYSRCLLGAHFGYPLWTPQLKTQLCESYQLEGLKIGDVGIVSPKNGSFDVLFNITLPRDEQPYPELVREGFTPVTLDRQRDLDTQPNAVSPTHGVFPRASVQLVSAQVHNRDQRPSKADYEFSLSMGDGAVLVLLEGAESCDLHNEKTFLGEAIRHGVDWYECATEKAGRLINNDSLYLITGFHKARSWSLGATDQSCSIQNPRSLKFEVGQIHNNSVTAWAYRWAAVQGFMGRVGPESPYGIPNCIIDERRRGVNQTVFIRGFRITVNKLLFLKTVYVETPQGTFGGLGTYVNNLLWGRPSELTQSSGTHAATDNEVDQDFSIHHSRLYTDTRMTINRVPDISQTFHPGDLINQYMLKKEPHAKVALTHDSLWIGMLQMELLELADFSREKRLEEVLSRNYRIIEEDGAVYLQESSPHKYPGSTSPSSVLTDRIQGPGVSDGDSLGDNFPGVSDDVWKDFPCQRPIFANPPERLPTPDLNTATESDNPYNVHIHFSASMEEEFHGMGIRVVDDNDELGELDAIAPGAWDVPTAAATRETTTASGWDDTLEEGNWKQNQERTTKPILCNAHGIICKKGICAEYARQLRLTERTKEAEERKAAGANKGKKGGRSGKGRGAGKNETSDKSTTSNSFCGPGARVNTDWRVALPNNDFADAIENISKPQSVIEYSQLQEAMSSDHTLVYNNFVSSLDSSPSETA